MGALAITITVKTARERLPFSLTWWSFTFRGSVIRGTLFVAPKAIA